MTAVSAKPWSNLEHWTLFTIYKGNSDEEWHMRAAECMEATRNKRIERRPKGFYTPAKCKEEFNRVMAEPCPFDVPTGSDYSRTAVVDAWIKHFTEEDKKDAKLFDELMQVKIRSYEDRLMKVWGNRDNFKVEQLEKMSSMTRKKPEYHERLAAYYYKHVSEKFHSEREKRAAATRPSSALPARAPHSPRKILGQRPRDVDNAGGSTSPTKSPNRSSPARAPHSPRKILGQRPRDVDNAGGSTSPTKSPNRSSVGDGEPMAVTVKEEEHVVEKMEVDETESKLSDNGLDSPRSQSDTKRPRGRPPKKSSSAATLVEESSTRDGSPMSVKASEEQKSPTRAETRRSAARGEASVSAATSTATEKDSIHVVDSPA
ncbi:hypothetical protein OSTOST_06571, partial [Ostertagia ostertagi]